MPELPEVETTTRGLKRVLPKLSIIDVWTNTETSDIRQRDSIKNPQYFKTFKKKVIGSTVLGATRQGKNILIELDTENTILIHMKMTGHLLYGKYVYKTNEWTATEKGPLQDPFNRFIRVVFSLSNGKHLAFSDVRKFGKITLIETKGLKDSSHLKHLGPDPLDASVDYNFFLQRLHKKSSGKIKSVLMDQEILAGIGNIYSDEMLWLSDIHPESRVSKIPEKNLKLLFKSMKVVLLKGIDFGGDSMSDYRDITGKPGKFQNHHNVYRKRDEKCGKKNCTGIIERKIVGGRSAHFCSTHQILYT